MEDEFETVAVTYSQPEAAVMLSFLAWHDVRAYALTEHAKAAAHLVTALGGIPVRVHRPDVDRARALLADVAPAEPPVVRKSVTGPLTRVALFIAALLLFAPPPPPRVESDLL